MKQSIEVSVGHASGVPGCLRGQELCVEVGVKEGQGFALGSPIVSEAISLPLEMPSESGGSLEQFVHITLPSSASGSYDLEVREISFPYPTSNASGGGELQLSLLLRVSLVVPLLGSTVSSDARVRSSSREASRSIHLAESSWNVPLTELLHVQKVMGYHITTSIGSFGVVVSVDLHDRPAFEYRLRQFFTAVNPNRLGNLGAILDVEGVDELAVFSKLHVKYYEEVPQFNMRGTFQERVSDFFEVYGLGSERAARGLLGNWKGRELELLATLKAESGVEPWEIPCGERLAAFCVVHDISADSFDALLAKLLRLESVSEIRAFFSSLRSRYGPEPHPRTYFVKNSHGTMSNDLLEEALGDELSIRRSLQEENAASSNSVGVRDYVRMQFSSGSKSDASAYKHLSAEEQKDLATVRQVHSGTNVWPLGSEDQAIAAAHRKIEQSSFVYGQAFGALIGNSSPASGTSGKRVLTVRQLEKKEAALAKLASMRCENNDASSGGVVLPSINGSGSMVRVSPSSMPRSLSSPERTRQSTVPEDDPERTRDDDFAHHGPVHRFKTTHDPPSSGSLHATLGMMVNNGPPPSFVGRSASARAAPILLDACAQTNPYGDLPSAHLEAFLISDVSGPKYAWNTFVDAAEISQRIPFHRLLYLNERRFSTLCMEVGAPLELHDSIVAERQRMVLASLQLQFHDAGSRPLQRMQELVVSVANGGLSVVQFRRVAMGAEVFHTIHRGIFQDHFDRFKKQQEQRKKHLHGKAAAAAKPQWSNGAGVRHHDEITKTTLLVRVSNSVRCPVGFTGTTPSPSSSSGAVPLLHSAWEEIAFGISEVPVRFPHDFWSHVRGEYRKFVTECASATSSKYPVPPPLHECPFDVFVCTVIRGHTVLESSSTTVLDALPEMFDSAVFGLGLPTEEATVIYNTQHIQMECVLLGCCLDPDLAACENHPGVASCFRRGQARQLLSEEAKQGLSAARLLELQAVPPLCLQCLAARALMGDGSHLQSGIPQNTPASVAPSATAAAHQGEVNSHLDDANYALGLFNLSEVPPTRTRKQPISMQVAQSVASTRPREQLDRAWGLWRSGSTQACLAALERIPLDHPDTSEASEAQGLLCELVDQHYINAAAHYREAIRRNPSSTSAMYRLGTILETRFGRLDDAIDVLEKAAALGDPVAQRRVVELTATTANASNANKNPAATASDDVQRRTVASLQPPVSGGSLYIPTPSTAHLVKRRF